MTPSSRFNVSRRVRALAILTNPVWQATFVAALDAGDVDNRQGLASPLDRAMVESSPDEVTINGGEQR
jgi:hypothetical protein